ncbi:MAG: glycosyltransferase 87 family protein, partial [Elioraea tepidiphila]
MAASQLGPFAGARPPAPAPLLALCLVPSAWYGWLLWAGWPASLFAPTNALVVRDFVNLWAGGRLLLAGDLATLFSPPAYDGWLKGQFGARLDLHNWSYPPPALALALPFGLLPLLPGFLLWTGATLAALALALRAGGMPAAAIVAILASPAAAENALAGQNGALFAALLVGGLASAERRPRLAGLVLGLLVMKPQLG